MMEIYSLRQQNQFSYKCKIKHTARNLKPAFMAFISALCIINSALFLSCGPQRDAIPVGSEDVIMAPHQEFGDASLFFYEGGVRRWWLDADYMSRPLADTGKLIVVPVRIMIYDSLGKPATRILADSGCTDSRMEKFDL